LVKGLESAANFLEEEEGGQASITGRLGTKVGKILMSKKRKSELVNQ
jgi:hypothetical protein